MNIFKKVKDIFYDDVEEEIEVIPAKKENHKKMENKKEDSKFSDTDIFDTTKKQEIETKKVVTKDLEERNLYQSKDTFQFPVFDEKDFESTLNKKRQNNLLYETSKRATETLKEEIKEERKAFRPSPVISPIYGVLDKNYKKDEIIDKKNMIENTLSTTEIDYDSVRRKAYGTLEDDLEDTLKTLKKTRSSVVRKVEEDIEEIADPKKHIESLLQELERTASLSVGEIEEALKNQLEDDEEKIIITSEFDQEITLKAKSNVEDDLEDTIEYKKISEVPDEIDSKKLENDLFNLIDSMYEGDEK